MSRLTALHSSNNKNYGVRKQSAKSAKKIEYIQSYLMISPQLLGFLVFSLYPILWVFRYAWFDYDSVTAIFVGFNNFIKVFKDIPYWNSLLNTFVIAIGKLVVELPLALIMALMLNGKLRGKTAFRLLYYMPNIISVSIVGIIFSYMFSSFDGVINNLLVSSGIVAEPINWFANKWTAISVLMIASIWQGFGVNMIYFLSGLMNIPQELYEAGSIDGANKWQQFWHITFPQLASVSQIVLMLAIVSGIKMNDIVLVLTNGQPGGETEVVMSYIFKKFFGSYTQNLAPQIGYACALAIITSIIIGIITVIYLRMSKNATRMND